MNTTSKLEQKKAQLAAVKERILKEQSKVAKLQKEIIELENFEILALSRELGKPSSEIRSLLQELIEKNNAADKQQTVNSDN